MLLKKFSKSTAIITRIWWKLTEFPVKKHGKLLNARDLPNSSDFYYKIYLSVHTLQHSSDCGFKGVHEWSNIEINSKLDSTTWNTWDTYTSRSSKYVVHIHTIQAPVVVQMLQTLKNVFTIIPLHCTAFPIDEA